MAARTKVKVGSELELAGVKYTVKKVGAWECVVEAEDGSKRFPRTPTVLRKLSEQATAPAGS